MPYNEKSRLNMAPPFDSERAKAAQKKSMEVQRANREARQAMKMSMAEWKKWKEEVADQVGMNAIDIMRIQMLKSLDEGDVDTAMDLAGKIAEFETPKLARQTIVSQEVPIEELSDEELEKLKKEAGL